MSEDTFSKIAHRYDDFVGSFNYEKLRKYLPIVPEEPILDLGGGTGRVGVYFVEEANGCIILDLSFKMLNEAKKRTKKFMLVQGFSQHLPFREQSLKQIFVNDTLHHIRDQMGTIRECYTTLAPEGKVIIREFDRKYFWNWLLILFEKIVRFRSKFLSPEELTEMCEEQNLTVSIQKPSKGTFIAIGKRKN
ncbi:MAG: methyltransferase domain-containing protein [Candidatus Heimdallarchaeota archaeon]|nr:methyltransferase domain-containing protein [Candidatus Heimdallarchaeota archaeon]MCK4876142.1 methyltransferase domain-containing protein [Candidatus Heimdallarchaeota archaeon]